VKLIPETFEEAKVIMVLLFTTLTVFVYRVVLTSGNVDNVAFTMESAFELPAVCVNALEYEYHKVP
jgi:hypothetical protein